MATHIDPFAPGDSPQHPANWKPTEDDHIPPELIQQSVETARRIHELMDRHILPAERDRGAAVSYIELERRQALVDAYTAGLTGPVAEETPIAVYVEDEGVTYRWEEAISAWTPIPSVEEPDSSPVDEPIEEDPMAAALAALDAGKGL